MIEVHLPPQLRTLARLEGAAQLEVPPPVTMATVIDALEAAAPELHGTIRDPVTGARRPFLRFFIGTNDYSLAPLHDPLPPRAAAGDEPVRIVGAVAGG